MRRALLLLALLALGGCAYYNGMYNTKRLAGRARQAEKEGRTFDASTLWGQVGVKAESVLAQHPNSKWADEARLLQATSMSRLRNCAGAVRPLEIVVLTSRNPELAEDATVVLGGCRTTLGDPAGAMEAYSRLTGSRNPERRRLALFAHGQAQRMEGNYGKALEELSNTDFPGAPGERAAALAGLGRIPEATALADSLVAAGDTLVPWDSLLALTGRHDPEAAAQLTDRLVAEKTLPLALRGRLLVADAMRWRDKDRARSDARLAELEVMSRGNVQVADARLASLRVQLQEIDSIAGLREWSNRIDDISEGTGPVAPVAALLGALARRVALTADSVPAGAPNGDLRLFLAGEMARDSLDAPRFAIRQFQRVGREWPASPYAPKALLALMLLEPAVADSLQDLLHDHYPASPYIAIIESGASSEYEVLEDSLRRFALSFRPEGRRPAAAPVRREDRPATATPREPVNR